MGKVGDKHPGFQGARLAVEIVDHNGADGGAATALAGGNPIMPISNDVIIASMDS
ncbi:MAG: hypothetical protein H0U38_02185 [Chloroflexia bacterium]|nr:hypothetical protein [Chloroflexia bacterium]